MNSAKLEFPFKPFIQRNRSLASYSRLYEGDLGEFTSDVHDIMANYFRTVPTRYAELMLAEPPQIEGMNDDIFTADMNDALF